jgi:hypothetical protein
VSGEIGRRFGALRSKPGGELVVALLEGDVARGEVAAADPVEVGAAGEEVLGDRLLVGVGRERFEAIDSALDIYYRIGAADVWTSRARRLRSQLAN